MNKVKEKSRSLFVFFLVLIACNIIFFFIFKSKNEKLSEYAEELNNCKKRNEYLQNYFIEREGKCVESENFRLSGKISLTRLNGQKLLMSDVLGKSQKTILVYRFKGDHCQTCIDIEIKRLKEYFNQTKPKKVYIWVSEKEVRELTYFQKINNIDFEICIVRNEDISLPLEQYNIPYLFLIDEEGYTNSVFIPEKNERTFSDQYYRLVDKVL